MSKGTKFWFGGDTAYSDVFKQIGKKFGPIDLSAIPIGAYNPRYVIHTIYTRNNMGHKCEGNCGLWVLNEILKKTYPENLKKIVGAVWELPAK